MGRYLVVANQTLGGEQLRDELRSRAESDGDASFHVLVPATPPDQFTFHTEGEAIAVAEDRLEEARRRFGDLGAEVTGEVGDANPVAAVGDALREGDYDEVILSTLPPGISKWLGMDLPSRIQRSVDLPVTLVTGEPAEA
ncbi:MAG: hypothetical protein R3343_09175 [Nitriliruptorales bacterium]|nr:hypothetical protein [Nitriliruptorales bacterium]